MSNVSPIGDNRSPFHLIEDHILDLYDEAKQWLDGEPVTTQEQADALNTLATNIRDAAKAAEKLRLEEVEPLNKAKTDVQDRFNSLIKKKTGKTAMALDAVKAALEPYLLELDKQQREEAEAARQAAEQKQREAQEAMQARNPGNLADAENAEQLVKDAKAAEATAVRAGKVKAHARGVGRATGLRTVKKAILTNQQEAGRWLWNEHKDEMMSLAQDLADKAVHAGVHQIPGFEIEEHKEI